MEKRDFLSELIEERPELAACAPEIRRAFSLLCSCYRDGGKLLICGNGGSAADSEHIVGELMKEFMKRRPLPEELMRRLRAEGVRGERLAEGLQGALPTLALSGAPALSSAYMNDAEPELVFAQQVVGYGRPGDTLLALSTSGNSENILFALHAARAAGLHTIGLTGEDGGAMRGLCDVCIRAPAHSTPKVQEKHLPIYHALCAMLEAEFF